MPEEPTIGQIMLWTGNFPPVGYLDCDGSLLQIAEYMTLYSLLGNTYGGDGRTTFALPDMRNRFPMHRGQGTGLTYHDIGDVAGAESTSFTAVPVPQEAAPDGTASVATFTGTPALPAMPPYQKLRFVIAYDGIYPSRW